MQFDHVAIAARSLAEGADWLEARLGLRPEPGGKHPLMGTHNLLLSLGPREYLELIAIDPEAPAPDRPRWFGLDSFDGPPRIAGWAVRQSPLQAPPGTTVTAASRGALSWRITIPDSGQMARGGAEPMRIAWDGSHPADSLPDRGLRLVRLAVPLERLDIADRRIMLTGTGTPMQLTLSGPSGEVTL